MLIYLLLLFSRFFLFLKNVLRRMRMNNISGITDFGTTTTFYDEEKLNKSVLSSNKMRKK